jgi:hypothetical protein
MIIMAVLRAKQSDEPGLLGVGLALKTDLPLMRLRITSADEV